MMAEKILALIVSFVGGAALVAFVVTKLQGLAIQHSPKTREMVRTLLDRYDARHAITRAPLHPNAEAFELGLDVGEEFVLGPSWPPHCDRCRKELKQPGALIFSPPNQHGECTKLHVCVECHGGLVVWMSDGKVQVES